MCYQMSIDYLREHLTTLHTDPNIYENGICNIITALEDFAIPAMEKEIPKKPLIKREFDTPYGREYYACPNNDCGEYIQYLYTLERKPNPCRCDFCGQVFDWDD